MALKRFIVKVHFGTGEGRSFMIREQRSRKKLISYYQKFRDDGILDVNVHPWVAKDWLKSKQLGVAQVGIEPQHTLSLEKFRALQKKHKQAIDCLLQLIDGIQEFFSRYGLSLLLLDADALVLKSYSLPFMRMPHGKVEGSRLGIEEIGASSISISKEHCAPFWVFGPEIWREASHANDACTAPVLVGGKLHYLLNIVIDEPKEVAQDAVIAQLLLLANSLAASLARDFRLQAQEGILDAAPFAVYHIMPSGEVAYANRLGHERLTDIGARDEETRRLLNLNDIVLNYPHTPIYQGFSGTPAYNKEVTWITAAKTYEDITTVVPLKNSATSEISSVVTVSMPIEDLRMLVAHTAGYTAKYSLSTMAGKSPVFCAVRDKALRVARGKHHVLLQGEDGTGKQRLAHGIHHASARAAGPLILFRCGDIQPERLAEELFGVALSQDVSRPGKLELAAGGTLFLDEIDKLPKKTAAALAAALLSGKAHRLDETVVRPIDVRIIGDCGGDLKRLTERGIFDRSLYDLVSRSVIRMPALRNRREDIPLLAEQILREIAEQHRMKLKELLPETLEMLNEYDWPDNIKQLQSVLEYAFFHTTKTQIAPKDISFMGDVQPDDNWKTDREIFFRAFKSAGGNVSRLANLLDVSRVTLYRYLKKFQMEKM